METTNLNTSLTASKTRQSTGTVAPDDVRSGAVPNTTDIVNTANTAPPKDGVKAETSDFEATASQLNELMKSSQRSIEFSVHEKSGRTLITVRDKETGEEIRTIPGEEVLKISDYLSEILDQADGLKPGILVSSQA